MKKVLFVVPSLETGGTISSLMSIISSIGNEYDISVLALSHDGVYNETISNKLLRKNHFLHSYYCSYSNCSGYEKAIVFIAKLIKRSCSIFRLNIERFICNTQKHKYTGYDVVIAFQEGNATKYVSYMNNLRKIAWIHCDYEKYIHSGTELDIYSKFSSVVCVSNFTANSFSKVYPTLKSKIRVIYNLLNLGLIQKSSTYQIDDSRFTKANFTILSVGRIHKVKRFEYIASIASQLREKGCMFKWYVIGPNYDDEYFTNFMKSIDEFNVSDCVIYLDNKINPYPYFKNVDLLVSLSQTEACPMIFNEAKVLGLPIVTSNFGSSYEFISDGESGIISKFENIPHVLESLIKEPLTYNHLKQNMAMKNYDNDMILSKLRLLLS